MPTAFSSLFSSFFSLLSPLSSHFGFGILSSSILLLLSALPHWLSEFRPVAYRRMVAVLLWHFAIPIKWATITIWITSKITTKHRWILIPSRRFVSLYTLPESLSKLIGEGFMDEFLIDVELLFRRDVSPVLLNEIHSSSQLPSFAPGVLFVYFSPASRISCHVPVCSQSICALLCLVVFMIISFPFACSHFSTIFLFLQFLSPSHSPELV